MDETADRPWEVRRRVVWDVVHRQTGVVDSVKDDVMAANKQAELLNDKLQVLRRSR